ncbi:Uncharacterised protein [Aquipseudomonas alcaligenes]|nr:Uncharacterised protein [Pseudomonas alcaligenes]
MNLNTKYGTFGCDEAIGQRQATDYQLVAGAVELM